MLQRGTKSMRKLSLLTIAGAMTLGVAACGGGGGSTTTSANVDNTNIEAELQNCTVGVTGGSDGAAVSSTSSATNSFGNTTLSALPVSTEIILTVDAASTGCIDASTQAAPDMTLKTWGKTGADGTTTIMNAYTQTTAIVDASSDATGAVTAADISQNTDIILSNYGFNMDAATTTFNLFSDGSTAATPVDDTTRDAIIVSSAALGELARRNSKAAAGDNTLTGNFLAVMAKDATGQDTTTEVTAISTAATNAGKTGFASADQITASVNTNFVEVASEVIGGDLTVNGQATATWLANTNASTAAKATGGLSTVVTLNENFLNAAVQAATNVESLATGTTAQTTFTNLKNTFTSLATKVQSATGGTLNVNDSTVTADVQQLQTDAADFTNQAALVNTTVSGMTDAAIQGAIDTAEVSRSFIVTGDSITITDVNGTLAATMATPAVSTNKALTANFTGMSASNLAGVLSGDSTATPPTVNMQFAQMKTQVNAKKSPVTIIFTDGNSLNWTAGSRYIKIQSKVEWKSDGTTLTLTAPTGDATITYHKSSDTSTTPASTATVTNAAANMLTVSNSGGSPSQATVLKAAVASAFKQVPVLATTPIVAGTVFNYSLRIDNFPTSYGTVGSASMYNYVTGTITTQ